MFDELAKLDWKALEREAKTDVPPLERAWFDALVGAKATPAKAQRALQTIAIAVFDQGCIVPATTPVAVRSLLEALAAGDGAACKAPVDVLHLLGDMAGASARFDALDGFDRRSEGWAHVLADDGCRAVIDAVEAAVPVLLPRLAHKTAKVRAAAAYAVAFAAPRAAEVLAALRARLPKEKDASAAASMILALANHLGYAGEAHEELVKWTKDKRELVAATASVALARRAKTDAHAAAITPVLLRAADRISKPGAEALPVPAFRFAGGNVDALALGALALLADRDEKVRERLFALLDDEAPLGGRDWFTTRTVARVVATALAGALPPAKVTSRAELAPATSALVHAFATRPWVWWSSLSTALAMREIPVPRLSLARWLGLRPTHESLLGRAVGSRGTIAEVVRKAIDDTGPLEDVIAALAEVAQGEDAHDLAEALCASGQEMTLVPWYAELPHHDGSNAQIKQHGAEQQRRAARSLFIAYEIVLAQGDAAVPIYRHLARGLAGHGTLHGGAGAAATLAWLAVDHRTGITEPVPGDFWSTAKHLMWSHELVDAFRAVLLRIPVQERIQALQPFSVTCGRDGSYAWLYAETIPLESMPLLVETYSMRPDDQVFPKIVERMRDKGLSAELDRVLAWAVSTFGTPARVHWSTPEGILSRPFKKSSGEEVTIYVVPAATSSVMRPSSWPPAR